MKSIELSSRETDRKVLIILFSLAFAASVGFVLPTPLDAPGIRLLDALITIALGGLAWGVFHLLEPERYGRKWDIVRIAGIPILWLLLVLALGVWFYLLHTAYVRDRERQMEQNTIKTKSPNKSLQPTRDGACSSASRFTSFGPVHPPQYCYGGRAWLSSGR